VSEPPKQRPATTGDKPKPFVPSSPAKKGTYGYMKLNINGGDKPHGFNGEYSYAVEGIATSRREKVQTDPLKPFYPSQPPKKGGGFYGTMRWGGQEYKEDPETEKWQVISPPLPLLLICLDLFIGTAFCSIRSESR
jgi:hypothetical protein